MKIILKLINMIFRILMIFLISFIWIRYFIRDFAYAMFLASVTTLIIDILLRVAFEKKTKRNKLKVSEEKNAENIYYTLAVQKSALEEMFKIAKMKNSSAVKKKNHIIFSENNKSIALYPLFTLSPLSSEDVLKAYQAVKKDAQRLIIVTGMVSEESKIFASRFAFEVLILDKYKTYKNLYKDSNYFPEIAQILKPTKKQTFKELLAFSFNKKRTKGYFFSSCILIFSSLIVRYNLYYLIVSTILLIFALLSYYNPFFNKKEVTNIFN